jgi:hypothetical protein
VNVRFDATSIDAPTNYFVTDPQEHTSRMRSRGVNEAYATPFPTVLNMDSPIHPAARVETELEALLVTIETIALTHARGRIRKHARGDAAHCVDSSGTLVSLDGPGRERRRMRGTHVQARAHTGGRL